MSWKNLFYPSKRTYFDLKNAALRSLHGPALFDETRIFNRLVNLWQRKDFLKVLRTKKNLTRTSENESQVLKERTNSIFYVNLKSFSGCSFEGMLASCPMTLGGHHVQASARINHCHSPIDVQFLVMANNDRNPTAHNTDTVSWLCLQKFRENDIH